MREGAIPQKAARRFRVRIYEKAICGNHLHFLVKAQTRSELQNFFRVLAGHIAQEILRNYPLLKHELRVAGGALGCKKNQRKFWSLLLYSRLLTWGREYQAVKRYIVQNTLEALGLIPYQKRKSRFAVKSGRCPRRRGKDTS
jgi:REP element-mobilizing transposase RayT